MKCAVDIAVAGDDKGIRKKHVAHFCDDGSVGVADFLGFKKVNDNGIRKGAASEN